MFHSTLQVTRTKQALLGVLQLEVLVGELLAVDALATGTIATGEITTLDHELLDDAVEDAALVVEGLAALAQALLAGAEGAEVLGRLGHDVVVQLEDNTAGRLATDRDIELFKKYSQNNPQETDREERGHIRRRCRCWT